MIIEIFTNYQDYWVTLDVSKQINRIGVQKGQLFSVRLSHMSTPMDDICSLSTSVWGGGESCLQK